MGLTHLSTDEWNLVVYYNTTNYWKELTTMHNGLEILNQICNKISQGQLCVPTLSQFRERIAELEGNNELLHHQTYSRRKRAPLNIIGNIAGSLFGVLDESYARKMAETIKRLEGNDQHVLNLLRNQTSIIDSTINVMKTSHDTVEKQMKEFDDYLNKTIHRLNAVDQELRQQRIIEYFDTLSVRLMLMVTNYQNVQSRLLDALIDTHHGKVNPQILTPKQLREQLVLIKDHLPNTLQVPGSQRELVKLYGAMSIESRVMETQIMFRINLPLFSHEQFELLRILPVPIVLNGTFFTINPSASFIIVDFHRDLYYPMSEQEFSKCTTIDHSEHVCRQHHPLYRRGSNVSSCEIAILKESGSISSCKFIKTTETPRWIQLLAPNHWIYVTKHNTNINVICGTSVFTRILSGSGIINITNGCSIKGESTILQASNGYPTTVQTSFVPSRNISDLINLSNIPNLSYQPLPHWEIENDIKGLQRDIQRLQNDETRFSTEAHHIHHYSVEYTSLIMSIVLVLGLLWNFCRKRQQGQNNPPIPAPRHPSAEAFKVDPEIHI